MKIGFISTVQGYKWAGSEELWWASAMQAINEGHDVACVVHTPMDESSQIKQFTRAGGKVFCRRFRAHPRLTQISERMSSALGQMKKWAPEHIVVSLGSPVDLCYWPACQTFLVEAEVPYTALLQFNAESIQFSMQSRIACRLLFRYAANCICVSQHNLDLLKRQLGLELQNANVVINPIRTQCERTIPFPAGELCFGCVARMEIRWKGHDVLLDCLAQDQWRDREWRLNLYGSGPDEEHVRALIKYYNLGAKVTMCGYVRDIQKVWSECHVKVLASHGEGTPLAVLEAMMCGRPTITTDVGGNREILENETTGFIADVASPICFGRALERAWEQRERWADMGRQAHLAAKILAEANPAEIFLTKVKEKIRSAEKIQ